jgi:hypothetical protein
VLTFATQDDVAEVQEELPSLRKVLAKFDKFLAEMVSD